MSERKIENADGSVPLAEELTDFLMDLASAYQKHSMYPAGHPALAPAVTSVADRLTQLLRTRDSLVIAVAKDQLIIEGAPTDREHLLMQTLAERLSRHQLGVLIFTGEVAESEIADLLSQIAVEPQRAETPLGLRPDLNAGRPNIRLHSMGYDKLQIREVGVTADAANVPCSRLWILLAEAALENSGEEERSLADPAAVAKAFSQRRGDAAYDKVIGGYLQTITREMKSETPQLSADLQSRVSGLVTRLDSDALQRLLDSMAGNAALELEFLASAANQLSAEAVLDLLEAAKEGEGRDISEGMMRVITKLARHASATGESQPQAEAALRDQVTRLIKDWNLENPNAEDYDAALAGMSAGSPSMPGEKAAVFSSDPERVVTMGLELDVGSGMVQDAADHMITGDGLGTLFDLLDEAPPESGVAPQMWERVSTCETLRQLTSVETPNFEWIDRLVPLLGEEAADPLLDALALSSSRSTRWKILERLAKFGPQLGPNLVERSRDKRWFVVRNMLSLLGTLPSLPEGFSPEPFTRHEHEMVRLEALKLSMKLPELRSAAVVSALSEEHERFATLAIAEVETSWTPAALPQLRRISLDPGVESRIRVPAIRCLARSGSPEGLDTLLQVARVQRRFLFWSKLPPRSPELVAALKGLRTGWPDDRTVAEVLKVGLRSSDPKISLAAGQREPA